MAIRNLCLFVLWRCNTKPACMVDQLYHKHFRINQKHYRYFVCTSITTISKIIPTMALQLGACAATCAAWCCCTSISSLLSSCCGNDKPSSNPAGPTSGRKRSVALTFLSVCLQLAFQFALSPYMVDSVPDNIIRRAWLQSCGYDDESQTLSCVSIAGNFRVASATLLFFVISGIAAYCKPTFNREAWPAKLVLYLFMVACTVIIPNEPYFKPLYLTIAIVGGVIFICLQQIVILDCSYNWNDSWVEKSNKAEQEEPRSGRKWLYAILLCCAIFFLASFGAIVYMLFEFTGCTTNNAFIILTLIFCLLLPGAQLSGEEGNLLSVSCICAWAVFLCYTAVIKNPDETCNPRTGNSSPVSIAYGLVMTLISLCWAGWSYTAEGKLTGTSNMTNSSSSNNREIANASIAEREEDGTRSKREVAGVVVTQTESDETKADENYIPVNEEKVLSNNDETAPSPNSWKLNVALAVVSCWCAMTLTQWGVVQANDGTIANRNVGYISMWVIIGSQWFIMTLYLWTLTAPRIFPNRDFS